MLDELFEFDLGHVHECIDFVFGALEILDAEGVDGNMRHPRLVAYLEDLRRFLSERVCRKGAHRIYLCQGLKPQIVSFHGLYAVRFGISSVPIHDKGNMFRDRALTQGADEELAELIQCPFCGRRREEPSPQVRHVSGCHCEGEEE